MTRVIFVDFDGTICPNKDHKKGEFPSPQKGCRKVLMELKKAGHTIIIYSVRSNEKQTSKKNGHDLMVKYLEEHNIPYDGIDFSKPHFSVVIDDKALGAPLDEDRNVNWKKVKKLFEKKSYL